jgi:peroxiredoxin
MPLQPGDAAPDFTLYDSRREPWSLSEHLREGPVAVLFFPGAFTRTCTDELTEVSNDLAGYESAGARVVGASTDAPAVLAEFARAHGIRFALVSDHDAEVSGAYGTRFTREEHNLGYSRISKRAAFVVGRDGAVRYAEVTPNPGVLPDLAAVRAALAGG